MLWLYNAIARKKTLTSLSKNMLINTADEILLQKKCSCDPQKNEKIRVKERRDNNNKKMRKLSCTKTRLIFNFSMIVYNVDG